MMATSAWTNWLASSDWTRPNATRAADATSSCVEGDNAASPAVAQAGVVSGGSAFPALRRLCHPARANTADEAAAATAYVIHTDTTTRNPILYNEGVAWPGYRKINKILWAVHQVPLILLRFCTGAVGFCQKGKRTGVVLDVNRMRHEAAIILPKMKLKHRGLEIESTRMIRVEG